MKWTIATTQTRRGNRLFPLRQKKVATCSGRLALREAAPEVKGQSAFSLLSDKQSTTRSSFKPQLSNSPSRLTGEIAVAKRAPHRAVPMDEANVHIAGRPSRVGYSSTKGSLLLSRDDCGKCVASEPWLSGLIFPNIPLVTAIRFNSRDRYFRIFQNNCYIRHDRYKVPTWQDREDR